MVEPSPPRSSPRISRILRRTDLYLLPFLALLFLLNSLDRSNIGNAETAGFTKYAGLEPEDLNDAVAWFFIAFVALQPVGAALGKRAGAGRWVGGVMALWGLLTMLNAWVSTSSQLIGLRVAIGALEAGFYPTTVFYLSLFYTRYEFARRLGWFYGQYAVAGAFGGVVSYLVIGLFPGSGDVGRDPSDPDPSTFTTSSTGWHSYQTLFVLEGALTIAVAFTTFFWLPTGPGSAWWLTREEAAVAEKRVLHDRNAVLADDDDEHDVCETELADANDIESFASTPSARSRPNPFAHRSSSSTSSNSSTDSYIDPLLPRTPGTSSSALAGTTGAEAALSPRDLYEAFTDWKVWYLLVTNICFSVPGTAFSIFLPLVLEGLGASPLSSNLLTVPPFLLGAAALWTVSAWSDAAGRRFPYILGGLGLNLFGLLLVCALDSPVGRYLALCLVLAGSFIASPLTVAWLSGNIEQPGKRAVVLGINGWGNLAGVVAGKIFTPQHAPDYAWPFRITTLLVAAATAMYAAFWWRIRNENLTRLKMTARWTQEEREVEERAGLGPWHKKEVLKPLVMALLGAGKPDEGGKNVGEWSGRRGDERATFLYGL